ncbi:uncharacterized protein K444DRAFT_629173 [Hyaloscypha bicolor E]|uniref:Uncharacterized protein n=1 Tax=Hyaloscypha bicolor E TaxID=1095630 RepID=A0A2J6TCC9_9HELO|nr:uncharacterized protein K444DRAFT_629173 [Hyaloscypha bicolor E]PMD60684.1 hypothetical protein K444DRAFT_629173 [Hyaloscypha bicolor E]
MAEQARSGAVFDFGDVQEALEQSTNNVQQPHAQSPPTLEQALGRIAELEAVNTTLRQGYDDLHTEYHRQKEDHERAITNEDAVEEELERAREHHQELEEENQELRGQIREFQGLLAALERNPNRQGAYHRAVIRFARANLRIEELEERNQQFQEIAERLQGEVAQLSARLELNHEAFQGLLQEIRGRLARVVTAYWASRE